MKWTVSHNAFAELQRRADQNGKPFPGPLHMGNASLLGVPIEASSQFPMRVDCIACAGTGSGGATSTYCPKCAGAGATLIDGIMNDYPNDRMQMLTRPLPRAFAVSFPTDITVPAAPMRGRIKEVRLP